MRQKLMIALIGFTFGLILGYVIFPDTISTHAIEDTGLDSTYIPNFEHEPIDTINKNTP